MAAARSLSGDAARLKEALKLYARSIGVFKLGVASPEPFADLREILERRRGAGLMTPFEEPDLDRRCDPAQVLPGAKALISIAVSYHVKTPFPTPPARTGRLGSRRRFVRSKSLTGWISKHAWGRDYHVIVREKMDRIIAWLQEQVPGSETKAFVDTGPTVDRAVAERAGVGWIGKNCSVIVPGAGSWVVLGTMITTVPFPPDPPAAAPGTECGDCDICLRACPTGALFRPHELDPQRCLSYVTQMKGLVPEEFRSAMGNRIYGCDTCQQVCPKNRNLVELGDPGFVPADQWDTSPDLHELLALTKREFNRVYGGKSSGWRGRKILQRNAVIALGNSRNPAALGILQRLLLHDVRFEIRAVAAWAVGQIGGHQAAAALREALTREQHETVRAEITAALAHLGEAGSK